MNKTQLIERWQEGNYAQIKKDLLALMNEPNLTDLKALADTTPEGRLDLRGLYLPSLTADRASFENTYENTDFSYSELGQPISFHRSHFINCLFEKSVIDCNFWGSSIQNCNFESCQINTRFGSTEQRKKPTSSLKAYFNLFKDDKPVYDYERMDNCVFIKNTFKKYANMGGITTNCIFEHNKFNFGHLYGTFENCQFIGPLNDVIFYGFQDRYPNETDDGTLFNSMKNVDFSRCEMRFVDFNEQCDLSQIIPPNPQDHCVYPYTKDFAERVEALGKTRGFIRPAQDLYRHSGATREFMMQNYPHNAEIYANDANFERHRFSIKWGVKTPRDYSKPNDKSKEKEYENDAIKLFELYRDALQAA
jgi:uncharacterized protein YjbI with pentapeptide repeats